MSMERRISSRRVGIGVRVVVRRLLVMWQWFLAYWAFRWFHPMASSGPLELSSRQEFLLKNYELQERLRQVFAPFYHLCNSECCCCRAEHPYDTVDGILYGIYLEYLLNYSPVRDRVELLKAIFRDNLLLLNRYFKKYFLGGSDYPPGKENLQPQGSFCPAFTEKGCSLPWGMRPISCVSMLCGRFLRAMDWREYWRYVWLNFRYLLLLTLSIRRVVAEWRDKQGAYSQLAQAPGSGPR